MTVHSSSAIVGNWGGHIRTIIIYRQLPYFSITLFFIILFYGFHCARAEQAEQTVQPGINSTSINSNMVSTTGTSPLQNPSPPAIDEEYKNSQAPQLVVPIEIQDIYGPQAAPCTTIKILEYTWLDHMHDLVESNTCESAVWFDSFFGREHVFQDLRPGTIIIIRNSVRLTEVPIAAYVGDFNLSMELPRLKKLLRKARIFIQSGYDADKFTIQPGQPVQPGVNRETGVRQPIIGVRIDPYTRLRTLVSIDSGIKINMHPDAFFRMRYQYLRNFGEVYLFRFSEIAMWQAVEHFSNTSQLDLERKITTLTLIRWGNSATYIEDTPGIIWNTGVSLFTQITPRSAISYDSSVWGVNYPDWTIQNYRVGSHYRRNIYRPWLFFEFSPEVTWPKDESSHRNPTYALMTTIEIQFGKYSK